MWNWNRCPAHHRERWPRSQRLPDHARRSPWCVCAFSSDGSSVSKLTEAGPSDRTRDPPESVAKGFGLRAGPALLDARKPCSISQRFRGSMRFTITPRADQKGKDRDRSGVRSRSFQPVPTGAGVSCRRERCSRSPEGPGTNSPEGAVASNDACDRCRRPQASAFHARSAWVPLPVSSLSSRSGCVPRDPTMSSQDTEQRLREDAGIPTGPAQAGRMVSESASHSMTLSCR